MPGHAAARSIPADVSDVDKAPDDDELEVSVFGPGVGESIVVHLGDNQWMVVDSCLNPQTRVPAALEYLDQLHVDVGCALKLLVLTHWHNDHIRGASKILQHAKGAQIACSAKDHGEAFFLALAAAQKARLSDTGLDEMAGVIDILLQRRLPGQREESVAPTWAAEGMTLLRRDAGPTSKTTMQVIALSPSNATLTLALHELRPYLPRLAGPERRAPRLTPNQRSVVVYAKVGTRAVLLGGDLENTTNPATGWNAIVQSHLRPTVRSEVFKVAHHGSANADNKDVWREMLTEAPVACLTPFSRGHSPLPTPQDLRRLGEHTHRGFCTRPARGPKPPRRHPAVERTVREVAKRHRSMEGTLGHIRVRGSLADHSPLRVELFGPAFRVAHAG